MNQVEDLMAQLVAEHSEPLHSDLLPYFERSTGEWEMLRHPLVYQVPFRSNGSANAQYAQKLKAVKEALGSWNYSQYVFLHERPYRVEAFKKIEKQLGIVNYWQLLTQVWIDTENQYAYLKDWKKLLSADRGDRNDMMNDEDKESLRLLPEEVTIYRGCQEGLNENGLSWTLDKSKAEFFANRFGKKGIILERKIPKSEIVALLTVRGETEVIWEEKK
jgi:hypothetical protein